MKSSRKSKRWRRPIAPLTLSSLPTAVRALFRANYAVSYHWNAPIDYANAVVHGSTSFLGEEEEPLSFLILLCLLLWSFHLVLTSSSLL